MFAAGGRGDQSPVTNEWSGRPGSAAGHLFAPRRRMVRCGHSRTGSNHKVDRATEVGVLPNCELVPWLCPICLMPPRLE